MLLHVARDRSGRRRLTEISLLRRTATGLVEAAPVWQADCGLTEHNADLQALLRGRMPA